MTDRETLDKAKALFTGQTQGDLLAREVIAIAEQREHTIACEVAHSRRLEDQLKTLHGLIEPLRDAVLYACAQGGFNPKSLVVALAPVLNPKLYWR